MDQTTRKSNARGRLVAGNKIHGIKKEFLSHYAPDGDGKFRCPFMDMIHYNYNYAIFMNNNLVFVILKSGNFF